MSKPVRPQSSCPAPFTVGLLAAARPFHAANGMNREGYGPVATVTGGNNPVLNSHLNRLF